MDYNHYHYHFFSIDISMCKYNPDDVIGAITDLHSVILKSAEVQGLPTDNLALYLNPEVADKLGFEDRLFLGDERTPLPIVRDKRIPQRQAEDGRFSTDFYMTDLDWGKSKDDFRYWLGSIVRRLDISAWLKYLRLYWGKYRNDLQ